MPLKSRIEIKTTKGWLHQVTLFPQKDLLKYYFHNLYKQKSDL